MKKAIITIIWAFAFIMVQAQEKEEPFRANIVNNEYEVYLKIDFYNESITVPGQDLYGQLPGYLGKKRNSFCWVITSSEINGKTATLSMINDYGSEDLTATLSVVDDSLYVLKQIDGSTLKVPNNGKWQKLPKTLVFKRE